jgi:hypothetical protein
MRKIAILRLNNPLATHIHDELKGWLSGNPPLGLPVSDEVDLIDELDEIDRTHQLVIAMAYLSDENIVEMNDLTSFLDLIDEYRHLKFIFLAWFHPIQDARMFQSFFAYSRQPNTQKQGLMNTDRVRLLQLPVDFSKSEISYTCEKLLTNW